MAKRSQSPQGVGTRSIGRLVRSLDPGSLWKAAAMLVGLAAGSFAFGTLFEPITTAVLNNPKTCKDHRDYPRGLWYVQSVNVEDGPKGAIFNDAIQLTSDTGGTWFAGVGTELPDGRFPSYKEQSLTIQPPIAPGQTVTLTYEDLARKYVSHNHLNSK